jgi:hypothetical protein
MEDWKTRAAKARSLLSTARHGDRESTLLKVAGGLDVNTLRRAITCLDYMEAFAKTSPKIAASLDTAPLSAIEVLARWHAFDSKGATAAVRELARGAHTVKSLTAEMKAARKKSSSETIESFEVAYRSKIERAAHRAVSHLFTESISVPDIQFKDSGDPPVDFRYYRTFEDGRPPKTIVALIVGPYQNKKLYRKRMFDWCFRALGLAWMFDDVVLLLPQASEVRSYRDWLASVRVRAARLQFAERGRSGADRLPEIHVLHPENWDDRQAKPKERPKLTREEEEALWKL